MSADERWGRVKALFLAAQQVDSARRGEWLQRECGSDAETAAEVRLLLEAQRAPDAILDAGASTVLQRLRDDPDRVDLSGTRIGNYRVERLLGEGGMGSVYLAERADGDFGQRVALKLVRADFAGGDARARFLRERDVLARLSHAHIAQLHDGGLAPDGAPYFTLEYVEGEPITLWCDAHRLGVRARLELVLQVCAAVAYAHRNLVVHRDLKPSNIFVTADGGVKLLDFGIAKLLDPASGAGATATQARLMTPEYAAPEQVLGEPITTATDVYAIGVLLYELLTGRLPYARAEAGAISFPKAVVEEQPESFQRALSRATVRSENSTGDQAAAARGTSLAGLRRSLRGDAERIVRRALAKQPEARYASVTALADDLRAFVDGRAISGGSRRYRMRMFARRHWLPLAASATIVLIAVASGIAIVRQSRQIAHEAQTTLAVKDFLFGLFTAVDPRTAKGRAVDARELLERGADRIARNKALDVLQRAEVEATLGRIFYQLGNFEQADKLQQSALAALAQAPNAAALYLRTELDRVETLVDVSDVKGAQTLLEDVHARLADAGSADAADVARAALADSRLAVDKRDWASTARFADSALERLRSMAEPDPALMRRALLSSGAASWGLGKASAAEATFREALAVAEADGEGDSIDAAKASMNIALALNAQSRYADAAVADEKAVAIFTRVLGADHQLSLGARRDLALVHFRLGLYRQARREFDEVIVAERRQFDDAHPLVAAAEMNLGNLLVESGDAGAAEKVLSDALAIFEKKYGRSHEGARQATGNLAVAIAAQGRLDEAERKLRDLLERERKESPELVDNIDNYRLGDVLRQRGKVAEAIALQRAALESLQKLHGENHRWTAAAHRYLALSLRDGGDAAGAEREWRAALAGFPDAEPPFVATVRYELGELLVQREASCKEGIDLLATAAELREKFLGADNPLAQQARAALRRARG